MRKPVSFARIGLDLLWVQLSWTFWFLGIILLVNVVQLIFMDDVDSFYSAGYIAGNIYMLVIGIIAITFLPYYVENGVTRKNYFLGNATASIGLSIILPIFIFLLSLIEKLVVKMVSSNTLKDISLVKFEPEYDGNIIGDLIQTIIISPFINPETNLFMSLALFSLNIFVFYLIGWLIGSAFSRLGVIAGIIFVAFALALFSIKDSMIRLAMDLPIYESLSFMEIVPKSLALPLVFVVVVVTITLIRLLTKRAPIKI
ncbi:hypothetical protein [Ornithinibacillus halophilus]|uniref:ABC-2 type transport system permease protein n=1 Tax=Ornithinibacillus halophilus TaxID=930117 RepID=A0A1M5G443_9BACI|nr:hypothetical protein [Ornithinibacillus halophilus]SHF98493.1 hypothetical protein SAMN05216225_101158 [Ornithinibacillus halophilus]